ncbi:phosphohydrolase, partial [Dickeya dianthicola]|nr:phosphohydrolase [Dickeya dianthicola]MCI4221536.1 phosphohydrolase [Dickeya dianthicola]
SSPFAYAVSVISLDTEGKIIDLIKNFYLENPDKKFLEETLKSKLNEDSTKIIDDIVRRNVWKKIYEKKHTFSNVKLSNNTFKECKEEISEKIKTILGSAIIGNEWALDFQIEDNFKDIEESQAKIIKKEINGKYKINELRDCNEVLQPYHHVKFFIRVFVSKATHASYVVKFEQLVKDIEEIVKDKINDIENEKK